MCSYNNIEGYNAIVKVSSTNNGKHFSTGSFEVQNWVNFLCWCIKRREILHWYGHSFYFLWQQWVQECKVFIGTSCQSWPPSLQVPTYCPHPWLEHMLSVLDDKRECLLIAIWWKILNTLWILSLTRPPSWAIGSVEKTYFCCVVNLHKVFLEIVLQSSHFNEGLTILVSSNFETQQPVTCQQLACADMLVYGTAKVRDGSANGLPQWLPSGNEGNSHFHVF